MKWNRTHYIILAACVLTIQALIIFLATSDGAHWLHRLLPTHTSGTVDASASARNFTQPTLPLCKHVMLFSAPRHGSTWLVDSIEGCRFRKDGVFYQAIQNSELWTPRHKLLSNVTVGGALNHLRFQCSVKMFPSTFRHLDDVHRLVVQAKRHQVPMVVLLRNPKSVFLSFKRAREHKVWNRVASSDAQIQADESIDEESEMFRTFEKKRQSHFEMIFEMIRRFRLKVDMFEYEDIKDLPFIVAENNACYIRNCNFVDVESA